MEPTDITVHVLREIRDKIDATNARLESGLAELRDELSGRMDEMGRRIVESELRTGTAVLEMHGTLRQVLDHLAGRGNLAERVERCEHDIALLKEKVGV